MPVNKTPLSVAEIERGRLIQNLLRYVWGRSVLIFLICQVGMLVGMQRESRELSVFFAFCVPVLTVANCLGDELGRSLFLPRMVRIAGGAAAFMAVAGLLMASLLRESGWSRQAGSLGLALVFLVSFWDVLCLISRASHASDRELREFASGKNSPRSPFA